MSADDEVPPCDCGCRGPLSLGDFPADDTAERDEAAEVAELRQALAARDEQVTRQCASIHRLTDERDGWRSIAESLRARDEAAQRVISAVLTVGPNADYHGHQIARLALEWRPLARTLAALCTVYDQTVPGPWRRLR